MSDLTAGNHGCRTVPQCVVRKLLVLSQYRPGKPTPECLWSDSSHVSLAEGVVAPWTQAEPQGKGRPAVIDQAKNRVEGGCRKNRPRHRGTPDSTPPEATLATRDTTVSIDICIFLARALSGRASIMGRGLDSTAKAMMRGGRPGPEVPLPI